MKNEIDVVVNGNIIADKAVLGGGIFLCLSEDELLEYDTRNAIVINGDVHISSINTNNRSILVMGNVIVIGKEAGDGK